MRRPITILIALVLLLIAIVIVGTIGAQLLAAKTGFNTIFASRFTGAGFKSFNQGDELEVVIERIGLPLYMTVNFRTNLPLDIASPTKPDLEKYKALSVGDMVLQYTSCKHRFTDSFQNFNVTIVNGRVSGKREEFYHEWY